ncbi:MAG: hypothetical protein ACC647_07270 [Anaerolineales bacterium]
MNIIKALFGTSDYESRTDTTTESPDPDPEDIWAFTDPDARDAFTEEGNLAKLEHDIRYEVMRGEPWEEDELAFKREIRRLLREDAITDKGTYWFTSPFPTVYRAVQDGELKIGTRTFQFRTDDDLVFQCRMDRDKNPQSEGPLLIDQLQPTDKAKLCGDMGGAMKGM